MIEVGKVNYLKVNYINSSGYFLIDPRDEDRSEEDEVFLPPALSSKRLEVDEEVKVFIYIDTTGQIIATTAIPDALVDEYAYLEVIDVQEFGSFLDWGIEKDLLVPANQQKIKFKKGDFHLVRICKEEDTERIFGTTKFGKYLEDIEFDIKKGDKVQAVAVERSELGYRVIVNKKYLGMIYNNEVFSDIEYDKEYDVYVKKIRDDGLVDIALQIQGIKNLDQSKKVILNHLFKYKGKSHLHDKSPPKEIKRVLGMSKKTFKNALGMLYKDKQVKIHKNGIELLRKND